MSIHKFFDQYTTPLKMFYSEFYFTFHYYFFLCFQQVTQDYLQIVPVFATKTYFDAFVPTTILTLWTKLSLSFWIDATQPIRHLFLLVSSRNKTMSPTVTFLAILLHLWQNCKVAYTSFFNLVKNSFAKLLETSPLFFTIYVLFLEFCWRNLDKYWFHSS